MSRDSGEELRRAVAREMQALQAAVDAYDDEAARSLGVNRTDLHCLEVLNQHAALTPSRLGSELGLTTGSVTAMLDRLERLGYLTRSPDATDRRKTLIQITETARERASSLYGPLVTEGDALMADYTAADLELLAAFLRRNRELYERRLARARSDS
ncbi:MarR family winged helix-turn-helix transcriptional regulator [Nonomuraea zeae]|uniref:MarR family transcriptional regulator n=1 Tax=Nonomuraea zeae TaxID=1642303 RepID=A0A5S4GP31_9ACTN|nr:MarR family transcriptional regulator [Nonomuraea zeae]TMR34311.1 MarR family transcriptional regulator [Nonomuraea zeae]